jgi:hypothetical protein
MDKSIEKLIKLLEDNEHRDREIKWVEDKWLIIKEKSSWFEILLTEQDSANLLISGIEARILIRKQIEWTEVKELEE